MSQQRPDRIKQMLHYLWQHRHLSTQQAIELFGYAEATVRRDFHYIASRYPGMVRGHVVLTSTTVRKIKNMFSTLSGRYKARRNAKSLPSPARSSRMETAFFSTPAPPVWNWQNVWSTPK